MNRELQNLHAGPLSGKRKKTVDAFTPSYFEGRYDGQYEGAQYWYSKMKAEYERRVSDEKCEKQQKRDPSKDARAAAQALTSAHNPADDALAILPDDCTEDRDDV